ncbi:unnamed protein product [Ranitomeya imitator]|uniref:POU domain, class 2, transcription factor 1 n=1 Tax=Ranitomeya imitator TaxID=111125 RepID=A0ABN9LIB2_9NEOB|nr:unnamed protein product [Ranitomeya imitator]
MSGIQEFSGIPEPLASGGSLPITSLDASGNFVFANAGGTPNIVTAPLFLNPQNLSLLTSSPVSLVSAAAGGAPTPITSLHAATSSIDSIQNSLFTVATASGPASTTTSGSKAHPLGRIGIVLVCVGYSNTDVLTDLW